MALSKEAIQELKKGLKGAMRQPHQFIYCAGGEDGDPVLIISKRVNSEKAKLRKSATKKQFASGRMEKLSKTEQAFVIEKTNAPKFEKDLKMFFGKGVPLIKKVKVMSAEDYDIFRMDAEGDSQKAKSNDNNANEESSASAGAAADSQGSGASEGAADSGDWTTGLNPEIKSAGEAVLELFEKFKSDPDSLNKSELKQMYQESSKMDKATQGDTFVEAKKAAKKDKEWRSERSKLSSQIKENRKETRGMVKSIKAMIKDLEKMPATAADEKRAAARVEVQAGIQALEKLKTKAVALEAKRRSA